MITTITLTYDGGGHRVMKKVGTVETWYLADGGEGGRSGQLRFIDLFFGIAGSGLPSSGRARGASSPRLPPTAGVRAGEREAPRPA